MNGYERTFDHWYSREHPKVLAAVAFAFNGMSPRIEDATNDAFLKALERWPQVNEMVNPAGWVTKVAINQARRSFRRRSRERSLTDQETLLHYMDPDQCDDDLLEALQQLSPRQRRAISLRYVSGMTQREISGELHVSQGTVAATLHQARSRLHELLTRKVDSK